MVTSNYELARPLASALKAKSPLVGIPVPGHCPLVFERTKLQRMLRGVKVHHISIDATGQDRLLQVKGLSGYVRCNYRILAIPAHEITARTNQRRMSRFAETFAAPKQTQLQKKIARLKQDKIALMSSPRWLPNTIYRNYDREEILNWYKGKAERKANSCKDELERMNRGMFRKNPCNRRYKRTQHWGPEKYAFLKDENYLRIREELRGFESIAKAGND